MNIAARTTGFNAQVPTAPALGHRLPPTNLGVETSGPNVESSRMCRPLILLILLTTILGAQEPAPKKAAGMRGSIIEDRAARKLLDAGDLIGRKRYKDAKDLVSAFQWGEAFGYDKLSSGGMGAVQEKLAVLPEDELAAIAEYLTSLK